MSKTSPALFDTLKQGLADIDRNGLRRRRRIADSAWILPSEINSISVMPARNGHVTAITL